MRQFLLFVLGFVAALVIGAAIGLSLLRSAAGFSARETPSSAEAWLATKARLAAMPAPAKARKNPIQLTEAVIAEARAHWADHCATCHANDGSGNIAMGKNMYPPAPDMRQKSTQNLTDGELFYIIENGIRLSGMPAWGGVDQDQERHGEEDSWKLVHFIRHLPQLSFSEKKEMERLNPKSPAELAEEKEEETFLQGDKNK